MKSLRRGERSSGRVEEIMKLTIGRHARTLTTVLGFATLTAAATLTALWPTATLADDDLDDEMGIDAEGTKLGHVVVEGEVVRDPKAKTGWVVVVTAENKGTEEETWKLETDLTRTVSSPMARAMPLPTTVWKQTESITLAAGQKIEKRYVVPAAFGAQLTATANADAAIQKASEAGKPLPAFAMRPRPFFNVVFQKGHA
jgi:hypothetical protein